VLLLDRMLENAPLFLEILLPRIAADPAVRDGVIPLHRITKSHLNPVPRDVVNDEPCSGDPTIQRDDEIQLRMPPCSYPSDACSSRLQAS
jgi:hypothetical protein